MQAQAFQHAAVERSCELPARTGVGAAAAIDCCCVHLVLSTLGRRRQHRLRERVHPRGPLLQHLPNASLLINCISKQSNRQTKQKNKTNKQRPHNTE
jgi:hypothetical protein